MKKTRRTAQVGDQMRAEIAAILRDELRDPALGFITVTEVEVAPDFRLAHVYVSSLGDEEQGRNNIEILRKASARVRRLLSQRLTLRHTPELDFRADRTAAYASSIEKILKEVIPPEKKAEETTEEETPETHDDE